MLSSHFDVIRVLLSGWIPSIYRFFVHWNNSRRAFRFCAGCHRSPRHQTTQFLFVCLLLYVAHIFSLLLQFRAGFTLNQRVECIVAVSAYLFKQREMWKKKQTSRDEFPGEVILISTIRNFSQVDHSERRLSMYWFTICCKRAPEKTERQIYVTILRV